MTRGAADTVVAVLDTGIDRSHPDLQGSFVEGSDAVNEDADPNDDHGHGTLVAGVIAARSNNGIGGVGACSQCSLMPVKVIAGNGSGMAEDIAEGIVWAADHGARVINISFVMSGPDAGVAAALEHARSKGVLIVAARRQQRQRRRHVPRRAAWCRQRHRHRLGRRTLRVGHLRQLGHAGRPRLQPVDAGWWGLRRLLRNLLGRRLHLGRRRAGPLRRA